MKAFDYQKTKIYKRFLFIFLIYLPEFFLNIFGIERFKLYSHAFYFFRNLRLLNAVSIVNKNTILTISFYFSYISSRVLFKPLWDWKILNFIHMRSISSGIWDFIAVSIENKNTRLRRHAIKTMKLCFFNKSTNNIEDKVQQETNKQR